MAELQRTCELAPLLGKESPSAISNKYIVALKDELTEEQVSSSMVTVEDLFVAEGGDNKIGRKFNIGKFHAFSATMTDSLRDKVRALPFVKYVEYDQVISIGDPAVGPV